MLVADGSGRRLGSFPAIMEAHPDEWLNNTTLLYLGNPRVRRLRAYTIADGTSRIVKDSLQNLWDIAPSPDGKSISVVHTVGLRTEFLLFDNQGKQRSLPLAGAAFFQPDAELCPGTPRGRTRERRSDRKRRIGPDRVSDNGTGIPREALDRIMDPFYTTRPGGTGLGLSIARQIVSAHRGTIAVESADGTGTTITLTLPASAAASTSAV